MQAIAASKIHLRNLPSSKRMHTFAYTIQIITSLVGDLPVFKGNFPGASQT